MVKTIKIDGKEVPMKATAATIIKYRNTFNRDLFKDVNMLIKGDNTDAVLEMMAYVMAKDADDSIPEFEEWLGEFSIMSFENASQDIFTVWTDNEKTVVKSKKKAEISTVK